MAVRVVAEQLCVALADAGQHLPEQRLRGLGRARACLAAVAGVPEGARANAWVLGTQAELEAELRVGLAALARGQQLVALDLLHLPGCEIMAQVTGS